MSEVQRSCCRVREEQSEHGDVRTEQEARLIRDVEYLELGFITLVSDRDIIGSRSKHHVEWKDLQIFLFEIALDVVEYNLDQNSKLLFTLNIRQQNHLDVSITDRQQDFKSIAHDLCRLHN